jgi:prepilin-type N-terminal cleavage/methylation domain-containing protein/prepilin-type processing-associated H-X9-DG protein
MSQRCPSSRIRGFTLVELLVVISIIALLVGLLLPSLSRARDQVRGLVCRSNLKQLMNGMFFYIADYDVFPGTHSLFWMQSLFTTEWPRPAGVTWDGARDKLVGVTYAPAYTEPLHLDPDFIADVPGKGTVFPYIKEEGAYTCPSDQPGEANDTPLGGGGNGRLSYSLNAYVGYKTPESLGSFTYAADSLDNPLPGGQKTRSFTAGQRVVFPTARFMTMFEEHPDHFMNSIFPDGNFNGLDYIATRHMLTTAAPGRGPQGRPSIAFLDGHAESPIYPAKTEGRELFTEFGQPHYWHQDGSTDKANISVFVKELEGPCPW